MGTLILSLFAALLFTLTVLTARAAVGLDPEADAALLDELARTGTTRLYTVTGKGGEEPKVAEYETVYAAENRIWCDAGEIPDVVKNALISIEDKRFYNHHGVDWLRTGKAFLNYVFRFDPPFGGSTVTQQLVKNVSGENDVKSERKIREILRALRLEKRYTKDEILTFYLNVIPLANRCYGIGAASAFYFGKTPSELTAAEAATLAATTNAPARYDPLRYPEQNAERRNLILSKMEEYGYLSPEEAREARAETVVFTASREDAGTRIVSWYTEAVLFDVIRDLVSRRGLSEGAATALVYRGGLEIEICCDPAIQRTAERVCRTEDPENGNLAVWVVDPGSGETLAVIGGAGEKKTNRGLHYATDALRPPGSALKPLSVYAPALRAGLINWATVFEDLPVKTLDGEPWPRNANGVYDGRIGVHEAIARSKNTVAVSVLEKLGKRSSFDFLKNECGFSSLVEEESDGAGRRLTDLADAPLALGQLTRGVTLRELCDAYSVFAAEGVFRNSVTYRTVKNRAGEILLENRVKRRRVLSPSDAAIMTGMLSETAEYGTARSLTLPSVIPTAGKTGTATGSSDRWFIGYTPTLLCGVLSTSDGAGDGAPRSPLHVWDAIMKAAHAPYFDGTDEAPVFPVPSGVLALPFCRDSGDAPGEHCGIDTRGDRIAYGLFTADNRPGESCRLHRPILYDRITGERFADDGSESPYLTRFSAPDGSGRKIPDWITPTDRAYDYDVLLGEGGAPEEIPDEEDGTAVSGGLGEWERIRAREPFRFGPRWFRHFFDP
ncbi:MAG: transglycosylase domain-containing protein [Clostridia bacterium]|nr:transglycosylase domain-containing protein [Clostridia bacterium]